jgi:hypothetical protein
MPSEKINFILLTPELLAKIDEALQGPTPEHLVKKLAEQDRIVALLRSRMAECEIMTAEDMRLMIY